MERGGMIWYTWVFSNAARDSSEEDQNQNHLIRVRMSYPLLLDRNPLENWFYNVFVETRESFDISSQSNNNKNVWFSPCIASLIIGVAVAASRWCVCQQIQGKHHSWDVVSCHIMLMTVSVIGAITSRCQPNTIHHTRGGDPNVESTSILWHKKDANCARLQHADNNNKNNNNETKCQ